MALWPFRRKSRRKRSRGSPSDLEGARGRASEPLPPARSHTGGPEATIGLDAARAQFKQSTEPNKLQRRARTYSFSPGRNDSIGVGRKRSARARGDRAPPGPTAAGANPAAGLNPTYKDDDGFKGVTAFEDDLLYRVPTLHNKRDGDDLPRKKSSKKRRKDGNREAEIRAMSAFVPLRPATEDWQAGRPMRKDTRRVRTVGFGFKRQGSGDWEKENRSSDISLPTHDSIHSAMSSDSEHISFKVGALEALAPRPTLRYTSYPRAWTESGGGGLGRRPTERRKFSEKEPLPEATLKAHKRVDTLADELSASDLRELMERDQRRRERKRQKEQEKIERRLVRQAQRLKAEEEHAVAEGRESPPNLERGVLGREQVGLGIQPASVVVTSSRRRGSGASPPKPRNKEEGEPMDEDRRSPLENFHRMDSIHIDQPVPAQLEESPEAEHPTPAPLPSPTKGLLRSKKSRSKSPLTPDAKGDASESQRKGSDGSSRGPMSWTSFFKWGKSKRTSSGGPSSFSNTSRDSMQIVQPLPAAPPDVVPRRVSAGVPKRTMSRFREDLPELPLSPPDSRIQSPEDDPIPPTIAEASPDPGAHVEGFTYTQATQPPRDDTPTSAMDIPGDRSTLSHREEQPGVSPEPGHAMSLASVDSEGSWLSGRPSKRRSPAIPRAPTPIMHFAQRESGSDEQETVNEDMSIAEDEYLSRFAHSSASGWNRKSTGEARPSSDEDDDARWGSVPGAQRPTVVHGHSADRMKSREGLLNSYGEEVEIDEGASYVEDEIEGEGLQRATSINLGKGHVRHVSAGSARLLNLTPRNSVDKRRSVSPRPEGPA
ncbi:hypothetical protein GQ53DRAFT_356754 [Thozetella sp. PMI_491]|nr:hypothetical protein GQ53DRAFT_356754 [Thozetella sp. PMI_491]